MASVLPHGTRGEWSWPNGREGLLLLLQAHECARDSTSDEWDFALEIAALRDRGLTENELRWLLKMGLVEHRLEATLLGDETRCFLAQGGLKFTGDSCFVLTAAGEIYVRSLLHPVNSHRLAGGHPHRPAGESPAAFPTPSPADTSIHRLAGAYEEFKSAVASVPASSPIVSPKDLRPTWDTDRKELWFGPHLVKRFKFQSPNQETILIVFHEEGWPAKIDDPLPPVPNQTSRQRLHDAIKNLNRHQHHRVIRFAGDGTGEGVRWERVESVG